jgi:predicted SPOUT superfamily RNA methylase MTH1
MGGKQMKTKTVAEVLELQGVNNIGISAILILNQQLEANKICVVDVKRRKLNKASIIAGYDYCKETVSYYIDGYNTALKDIAEANCVKFREGGV